MEIVGSSYMSATSHAKDGEGCCNPSFIGKLKLNVSIT